MSGEELLRRLLARHGAPLPPFLFITAYASVDRAVEALKLGAVDYITKPFDIEQLIDKTRRLIGAWAGTAEDRPERDPRGFACYAAYRGDAAAHRRQRRHGAYHGRVRGREGEGRAAAPPAFAGRCRPVRSGELRGVARDAAGIGAVRLRERRVHRRHAPAPRAVRAGAGRHACSWTRSATCR